MVTMGKKVSVSSKTLRECNVPVSELFTALKSIALSTGNSDINRLSRFKDVFPKQMSLLRHQKKTATEKVK